MTPSKASIKLIIIFSLAAVFFASCSAPERRAFKPPTYPAPPAETRYIYEGSLRTSNSISEPDFADKLRAFATGTTIEPYGLAKPYGIAVKNERVYVSDTQQRAIVMFNLAANKLKIFGTEGQGRLLKPLGITISNNGDVFVADITAKRVVVYDADGHYLRTIGNENFFERPSGIALSPDSTTLYVVDTGGIDSDSHHIVVFNALNGDFLQTIGQRGTQAGELNIPLQATVTPDGKIYVVDSGNFRVQAFNPDGSASHTFGSIGRKSGQFSRPKGIASDINGNIYVVDTAFGNLQIFSPQGELLLFIGDRGTSGAPGRFSLPAGIAVDGLNRIYVVDQFFRKVDIFRPINTPARQVLSRQYQQP